MKTTGEMPVVLTCCCGWEALLYRGDEPAFLGAYLARHLERHHFPETNAEGGGSSSQ
jgi:hypothetical protein